MDLKNNRVTVGELLDYAPARAVVQRRFPLALRSPLVGASRSITLEQLLDLAGSYIPRKKLEETLAELRRV